MVRMMLSRLCTNQTPMKCLTRVLIGATALVVILNSVCTSGFLVKFPPAKNGRVTTTRTRCRLRQERHVVGTTRAESDENDDDSNIDQSNLDLVAACDYSHTFPPSNERLTVDGERILYRRTRTTKTGDGLVIHERPLPHLYDTNNSYGCDLVIDKNGYAWRTQEALRKRGLKRHNMEETQQLWKPLWIPTTPSLNDTTTTTAHTVNDSDDDSSSNATVAVVQMPIPWNGPLNLPPQERGIGTNRKLRDDLQFGGCELDDERWIVYFTKLAKFSATYGHVDVPLAWQDDESLGRWVFKQRVLYRRYARNNFYQYEILQDGSFGQKVNPLSPWRIQMLYDIGFSFKINLRWNDRLAQLQRFKDKHGHVKVPEGDDDFRGLNLWIRSQRTECRRWKCDLSSSMTKQRFELLDQLGIDWDPLASIWDSRIHKLRAFREKHGHVGVTKTQDSDLASWLIYIRSQYRIYQEMPWDSALTSDRIRVLESLGIEWEPLESRWQQQFQALVDFQQQNGHTIVPVDYPENLSLSSWVQRQRHDFKAGDMPQENKEQLASIGFVLDRYDEAFARGRDKLKSYKEAFGNCRVPRSYSDKELVSFVKRQRSQYKRLRNGDSSSMTAERQKQLEELGFEWRVRSNIWNENFDKLRAYNLEHGNCNVPSDYHDKALYRFVSVQRTQYKLLQSGESQRLTPARIQKLETLGFAWNTNDSRWRERYNELVDFQREKGHCNVPDKYSANKALGTWVRNQRVQYRNLNAGKKSTMNPSRVALLEEIGFQWSVRAPKLTHLDVLP